MALKNFNMKLPELLLFIFSLALFTQCRNMEKELPERGICAHRGEHEMNPENTLPAFKAAVDMGAHMIEFDVRLTKDKKPVIMHDKTVDRTTNGTGGVSEFTLAEIRKLDAGSSKSDKFKGVKVPTLQEVLDIMPENVWLNVHLKGDEELGRIVAEVIRDNKRMKQAVIACDGEVLKGVRGVGDDFLICNMERMGNRGEYVDETIKGKFPFIQLLIKRKDETFAGDVKRLNENKVKVNYYHGETPEETKELFDMGVNFVLTNNLDEMLDVAESIGIERRR
jgi:glycerophosphoryl diester phosphodiesterase